MEKLSNTGVSREQFGSKIGFILAAAGSAVGLGNIWKFPYLVGQNGGGAFVIVYLICIIVLGFSLTLAEFAIGRNTQLSPVGAFNQLNKKFTFIGVLGVLAAFLIMGYYPVVGGWSLSYIFKSIMGGLAVADPTAMGNIFTDLISGTWQPIFWTAIYMIINIVIVAGGISDGIEKASKVMMPLLFIFLIILGIRSITLPGAAEGVAFLFKPDWSQINGGLILAALGQVFFSLSLGMGIQITYASYLSKKENLVQNAFLVPALDTFVAILSAVMVIPACIAFGFEVGQGPGLVFATLPAVFATMGPIFGKIFGTIFFILIALAALTSSISLTEAVVSYLIDERGWARKKAVVIISIILFIMCITASLSMGLWSGFTIMGRNIFDTLDYIASYILLPLAGMFTSVFIGWIWGKEQVLTEVTNSGKIKFSIFNLWFFLCRWIIPVIIFFVFLSSL
ncbi:sodium-dependent transporter [Garciella nitratireducens]|uniref:sodium-dependent transporter n=1 Tax=Garciella nitratireducens TaxID=218205 RepID=UPI000DEBA197|nr:sodium-dependent transporter [Garciella nitratireducens]RBP44949.1 NSS family neurotransmitter:Na+ symporter [Garciella nitratireducens]